MRNEAKMIDKLILNLIKLRLNNLSRDIHSDNCPTCRANQKRLNKFILKIEDVIKKTKNQVFMVGIENIVKTGGIR